MNLVESAFNILKGRLSFKEDKQTICFFDDYDSCLKNAMGGSTSTTQVADDDWGDDEETKTSTL
jgi:hypothetical protein